MAQEHARAVEHHQVGTLTELIEALESMRSTTLALGADWDTVYTNGPQKPAIGLTLVERVLTDGSKVYDVEVG